MEYEPIPCKHEKDRLSIKIQVDDHHPLTKKQIQELLQQALNSENPSLQQARLIQSIPGMKCPRECEGEIAKKEIKLDKLFMQGLVRGKWTIFEETELIKLCS